MRGADTLAIKTLLKKADGIPNPDSAIAVFDQALQLSKAANYADGAFTALIHKSIKYYEKGDYANIRKCCIEALQWSGRAREQDATAQCYNNMGNAYLGEGDYIGASTYYYKALDESGKTQHSSPEMTAGIYNNLGLVNIRLGQPDKALSYFLQAADIARKSNLDYQLSNALANAGEYYNSVHKPDSALKCFNEIMQIGQKSGNIEQRAQANDELGKTFIETSDYQKAIHNLQLAISQSENRFPYIAADASYSLGDALCHTGRYKEAEAVLLATLKETREHNFKDNYMICYSKLIDVYKATEQYKKALNYADSLAIWKDSLTSFEKASAINQMEIKYHTAEKDKQIIQNQLVIAQQQSKLVKKNIWIASIAGSIVLLSIILVSVFLNSRQKQRLQAEQIKTLQQENTISILNGVVQGEEKERGRLARELHDGIGGILSATMMRMMSMRHEKEEITSMPAYIESMNLLEEMGDEIRKTAHNLMPEVLLKQSLPEAIRTYCNFVEKSKTLHIDFQTFGSFDTISQKNKLNIYRIVQELLKNITQHANATNALLQLLVNEQLLTITIEDNGTGFNAAEITKGIGLHNLQTRVNSMFGHFTIESGTGKGTSVYIEFDKQKMITYESI